ncbi:AbiH family protein [Latilactobacillus fragifolii]|uniref:AbiH family protein n=1 Tax=Latilactobacillus fragifolii TaxID=2814244 RepID=UPI001ABBD6DC|nr:AbiH family protein [Latilactobacillus fragifolii]
MNLFILGNGFDLMAGAKTSIVDYLTKVKESKNYYFEIVENYLNYDHINDEAEKEKARSNLNKLGFWTTLFLKCQNDSELIQYRVQTWKNIEYYIFLVVSEVYYKENEKNKDSDLTSHEKEIIQQLIDIAYPNEKKLPEIEHRKDQLSYLYQELLRFDIAFAEYLNSLSYDKSKSTNMSTDIEKVLSNKAHIWSNDLVERPFTLNNDDIILNFNYTSANHACIEYKDGFCTNDMQDSIDKKRHTEFHIHGTYRQAIKLKPINDQSDQKTNTMHFESIPLIFGFDQSVLVDNGVYELNRFTKTYQLLELARYSNNLNSFFKTIQSNSDLSIKDIYFIGHSLNKSDWSYFFAIFDFLKLPSQSDITLHFLFSKEYAETNTEAINEYENSIFELMIGYGDQLKLVENGSYLMTKLLLEGNIKVEKLSLPKEINEFYQ